MPTRNWNKRAGLALWLAGAPALATAQSLPPPATPPATATADASVEPPSDPTEDPLIDALSCRGDTATLAGLLPRLRRERPQDFAQAERQYSDPPMDLYRLQAPVQAWGHQSDAVVITANRVLMVVDGGVEQAARQLEASLAETASAPLSGALDDQHALVLYAEQRPGLQQRVLIGCEYRMPDLSLLDDPEDAWRKPPPPAP